MSRHTINSEWFPSPSISWVDMWLHMCHCAMSDMHWPARHRWQLIKLNFRFEWCVADQNAYIFSEMYYTYFGDKRHIAQQQYRQRCMPSILFFLFLFASVHTSRLRTSYSYNISPKSDSIRSSIYFIYLAIRNVTMPHGIRRLIQMIYKFFIAFDTRRSTMAADKKEIQLILTHVGLCVSLVFDIHTHTLFIQL